MGSCSSWLSKGSLSWESDANLDTIEFKKHKLIGVGAFGRVWAATIEKYESKEKKYQQEGDEHTVYALKEMNKAIILAQGASESANNEVKLMRILPKSPFIVNLWYAFQSKNSAFLLMDYAPWGDLLFHMKNIKKQNQQNNVKGGTFTEDQAKFIVVWLLEALRVCFEVGIVHRDIKPDNIILDVNGYPKLADFGVAEMQNKIKEGSQFGTLSYMAPEIIFGHAYSYQADYYSIGVLLLLMVSGDMLSVGKTIKEAKTNIALRRDSLTTSRFIKRYSFLSTEWNDIVVRFITTSQHHRIGASKQIDEILEHEWFNDVDVEAIRNQTYPSPIYDIVTHEENILKLTEVSNNRFTQYWKKKTEKAMKIIGKKYIDDGEFFKSEFHEFQNINVIEKENYNNHRDSVMVMRRHTMSSIRKHRENSMTGSVFSGSDEEQDSPFENFLSPPRKSPATPNSALPVDAQSGFIVQNSPPNRLELSE
jgi:serine/threonine protein kinase